MTSVVETGQNFAVSPVEGLPYTVEDESIRSLRANTREWALETMPDFVKAARRSYHDHLAHKGTPEEVPLVFPHKFIEEAAGLGYLGMDTPEEYGGVAMTSMQHAAVVEELARVDAGLALKILVQNSLSSWPIAQFGTDEQKQSYLPHMAAGELIGSVGLSEPGVGSDLSALTCRAEKVDGGWTINGAKTWITNANAEGVMVLAARTGDVAERTRTITTLLVPLDTENPGLVINTIPKQGQHGSQFCEVVFDDYFVPDDQLDPVLGTVNEGWDIVRDTLTHSRTLIAAQGTGIAMHGYDEAVKYAEEREMFGAHLSELPLAQRNLAHMRREIDIARMLVKKAAWHEEQRDKHTYVWASLAKAVAGEVAFLVPHEAQLMSGGMGYTEEAEVGHVASDGEVIRIYEGAREVQLGVLRRYFSPRQLLSVLPTTNHPLISVKTLPTAEEVMREVDAWKVERRAA